MDSIIAFISTYITYWPLVCFFSLILAGLNLPVSEDVMIVMSALIASQDDKLLIPNYLGLLAGIYAGDLCNYLIGRFAGSGVIKLKKVSKKLTPERIQKITDQLEKHGLLTYIVTRFIPFGIRNVLFMTSGMIHLAIPRFMLYNGVAAIISSATLYSLVYFVGESAAENFKIVGYVLFAILVVAVVILIVRHEKKKRTQKKPAE